MFYKFYATKVVW